MVDTRKKTRPNPRKRSALRLASSPQASASGVAEPGKSPASRVPGKANRFFGRFSRRGALVVLALALLAGVCYLPAMLWGGLIWDDFIWFQSPAVLEWSGLGAIWSWPSSIEQEKHYWPLTYTTFWLEHKIWGLEPTGYHVVNVLLHLLNSLLLWRLLLRLVVPGAWVVAAVFVAHPLNVESVAWIIERKDVLSGLFYLLAVIVWLRFLEQPRPWRYGLALLLFVAGLLSKSVVVTLPVALLVVQWWKTDRITTKDLQRVAPFFLVALLITLADLYSYDPGRHDLDYSWPERVLIASRALWFYAGKLVWPTDLSVIYPRWNISLGDPWAWLYLAAALVLAAVLWLMRHRIGRGPLAGTLFFVVTLSPVLGFVNHGYMEYSLAADRFQYLAGIGVMAVIIGAAVHGASRLSGKWKMGATGLLVVLLAFLGTRTWRQAGIYRDDVTFFNHVISLNPKALNAHRNLGLGLIRAGRLEEALAAARIAVAQRPDFTEPYFLLGEILVRLDRLDDAKANFRRVLEIDPRQVKKLNDFAEFCFEQKRYREALDLFRMLLEVDPDNAATHSNLGAILHSLGQLDEVEKHFVRALQIAPRHKEALGNLAWLRFEQKRYREALDLFRMLLEVDPDNATTHSDIGVTLYHLGQAEAALRSFKQALSVDPTLETARTNLKEIRKTLQQEVE
ncbi:MAG: tetratricopeptide repeat protein [Acidobacteriota bacterium]|nr:tetratricopeptide repeat protein [Acidobacteriota bacterium]